MDGDEDDGADAQNGLIAHALTQSRVSARARKRAAALSPCLLGVF